MLKLQCNDDPRRGIWLVGDKVRIGRDLTNDFILDGLGVAPFHAEIIIQNDTLLLKSRPGSCFVDDLPVDGEYSLATTDKLRIGKERLSIVNSKQLKKIQPVEKLNTAEQSNFYNRWRLLPAHPKLEDRQFVIEQSVVIGRSKACGFSVPYRLLSREHARLQIENGLLMLEDLTSANGCFVNGERVSAAELKDGDSVAFASLVFTVKSPVEKALKPVSGKVGVTLDKTMIRPAISSEMVSTVLSEQAADTNSREEVCNVDRQIAMKPETTIAPAQILLAVKKSHFFTASAILLIVVAGLWFSRLIDVA